MEASQDFRPVVLLSVTTDCPLELHDSGPNQVINQTGKTELKFWVLSFWQHLFLVRKCLAVPWSLTSRTPDNVCCHTGMYTDAIVSRWIRLFAFQQMCCLLAVLVLITGCGMCFGFVSIFCKLQENDMGWLFPFWSDHFVFLLTTSVKFQVWPCQLELFLHPVWETSIVSPLNLRLWSLLQR